MVEPMTHAATEHSAITALRFGVVDVETSGLSPSRHRVLQVAVVTIDGDGTVLDSWCSLVRPRLKWLFRLGPRHIHGLNRRDLRRAPKARSVMRELARRLDGSTFTAHNAGFDAAFLQQCARRAGVTLSLTPSLCTLYLSRRLDPDRALSHRLADVTARFGIHNERPHDALQDALATAALLPHLLQAHGVTDADQLAGLTRS